MGEYLLGGSYVFSLSQDFDMNYPFGGYGSPAYRDLSLQISLFFHEQIWGMHYSINLLASFETSRGLNRNFLIPLCGIQIGMAAWREKDSYIFAAPVLGLVLVTLPSFALVLDSSLWIPFNWDLSDFYFNIQLNLNFII